MPIILAVALAALTAPAAAATGPFTRAFTDDVWFTQSSPAAAQQWVRRTQATGAKLVLLEVDWVSVEPSAPPAGADPTNPAGSNFDFAYLDPRIKAFENSGISVALLITDAPAWAEAPGGTPVERAQGAWEPDPTAFGQVATAIARRYSGSFPDPANPGQTLPRVRYFQGWAEANFTVHLAPQWVNQGGRLVPFAPGWYRTMLNSFYSGVKAVHGDNQVITTGFGPYGDPVGNCPATEFGNGCRMHPLDFAKNLLCLQGSCSNPAHFDILAMDPYEVSGPTQHAYAAGDISAPDLGKLTRVLNQAASRGTALPRGHKALWVTEFSYESNPPNPTAPSAATQARWLEQSLFLFREQGVNTAVWYLVSDQPGHNYNVNYFSGVYFNNGTPKPSFEAYRFPFVVMPYARRLVAWGIAPRSGAVSVQRQQGRKWKTLFTLRAGAGSVFQRGVSSRLAGTFRAVMGGEASLVYKR